MLLRLNPTDTPGPHQRFIIHRCCQASQRLVENLNITTWKGFNGPKGERHFSTTTCMGVVRPTPNIGGMPLRKLYKPSLGKWQATLDWIHCSRQPVMVDREYVDWVGSVVVFGSGWYGKLCTLTGPATYSSVDEIWEFILGLQNLKVVLHTPGSAGSELRN